MLCHSGLILAAGGNGWISSVAHWACSSPILKMNKYSAAIIHYSTEHSKRERDSGVSSKRSWLIWIILFCHGLCEAAHGSQTECPALRSKGGLIQGLTHSLPLYREECYFNRSGERKRETLTEQESTEQTNAQNWLHQPFIWRQKR